MTVEEWLGEENQLGKDIWTKKYCNEGENFEDWLARIRGGNEEIAEYIRQKNKRLLLFLQQKLSEKEAS